MSRPSLLNLATKYFTRRGYGIRNIKEKELKRNEERFDLFVSKRKEVHPVRVKEWNRTVGVNFIIKLDQAAENGSFSNPIMVADKFSEHAKAYAHRRGLTLITKSEIIRSLR